MKIRGPLSSSRGVTLIELLVGVTFLSVVVIASVLSYSMTIKSLVFSRARGTSARLAQDQFETLQGLTYDLLLVTPQSDLDIPPGVDLTNYPPQSYKIDGRVYTRSTVVSKAYRDASSNIVVLSPTAADTGLKQIKVTSEFNYAGFAETKTYSSLVTDPALLPLDGNLFGVVTDTGAVAISNAKVFVTQNQNWTTQTSSTGYYQIQTDTKTYTATVTKAGYWDTVSSSFTATGPLQLNFQLQAKLTGRATGAVTARPRNLLISGVFAGTSADPGHHFLELYNPTTYQMMITDGLAAQIGIRHVKSDGSVIPLSFTWSGSNPIYISTQAHFLIATTSPTINGVAPNALFSSTQPFSDLTRAGAALQNSFGVSLDTVGWTSDGTAGPAASFESTGVYTGGSNFGSGGVLWRKSGPSSITLGVGNSYDSGDNINDVLISASVGAGFPRNAGSGISPAQYGIPCSSPTVLATDGYSAATIGSSTGYYLLESITTGTWAVAGYWTNYSSVSASVVQVLTGATTTFDLLLEPASGSQGGISGRTVRSDTLAALPSIAITAGTASTLTDSVGSYVLSLSCGTYTVAANEAFSNISYNTLSSTATAPAGSIATGVNFNLVPSGVVTGKVTTNGTDPYPNIPVHGIRGGLEVATTLTNSSGDYTLYGIPVGLAIIEPILDPQSQTSNPTTQSVNVLQGNTHAGNNFTVTTSLGKIIGSVTKGTTPITTGTLIVATTGTIASLPDIDNTYRTINPPLFSTTSDPEGRYTLTVVRNATYTVYGYFSSSVGFDQTNTQSVSSPLTYVLSISTVNLQW